MRAWLSKHGWKWALRCGGMGLLGAQALASGREKPTLIIAALVLLGLPIPLQRDKSAQSDDKQ